MNKTIIEQEVANGAAVLDLNVVGWEWKVDPNRVTSICDPGRCVLCQTHGNWTLGMNALFGTVLAGYRHGFACLLREDAEYVAAWRTLIVARRAARSAEAAEELATASV